MAKRPLRALSIRQPHAENILAGRKTEELRSRPTSIRERVYIYASLRPAEPKYWRETGLEPGDLTTGLIVGSVEIVGCRKRGKGYAWQLANPKRLRRPLARERQPTPSFFYPFW
jgi:hypothetical protein